ncbi:MAG: thioredoxin family protein [Malacoplasma sp.]|nr:thioredoxin family protein [Malacoplasma sp.]
MNNIKNHQNKPSAIFKGKDENIETLINQTKKSVLKFGATWCGPCKMLAPELEALADEMADVTFIDVDVDDENCEVTVKNNQISSVPCILFFKDGQIVDKIVGYRPKSEIKKIIDQL